MQEPYHRFVSYNSSQVPCGLPVGRGRTESSEAHGWGVGEAHGRGRQQSGQGRRCALGPEAAVCSGRSDQGRG
jgi:hypothetical protein